MSSANKWTSAWMSSSKCWLRWLVSFSSQMGLKEICFTQQLATVLLCPFRFHPWSLPVCHRPASSCRLCFNDAHPRSAISLVQNLLDHSLSLLWFFMLWHSLKFWVHLSHADFRPELFYRLACYLRLLDGKRSKSQGWAKKNQNLNRIALPWWRLVPFGTPSGRRWHGVVSARSWKNKAISESSN